MESQGEQDPACSSSIVSLLRTRVKYFPSQTNEATNEIIEQRIGYVLEESLLPRTPFFGNLSWWKTNGLKFPTLQKMARDLLVIPVSTVASESAFSTSGRLISPHRSRFHPTTLETLMCARTWLWNEIKVTNFSMTCHSIIFQFLVL